MIDFVQSVAVAAANPRKQLSRIRIPWQRHPKPNKLARQVDAALDSSKPVRLLLGKHDNFNLESPQPDVDVYYCPAMTQGFRLA